MHFRLVFQTLNFRALTHAMLIHFSCSLKLFQFSFLTIFQTITSFPLDKCTSRLTQKDYICIDVQTIWNFSDSNVIIIAGICIKCTSQTNDDFSMSNNAKMKAWISEYYTITFDAAMQWFYSISNRITFKIRFVVVSNKLCSTQELRNT